MLAAVRVRGVPDTGKKVSKTLQSLRLHNKNNCTLLHDSDSNRGMLDRARNHIAYGEVDADTVEALLEKRGKVHGNPLTDELDTLGYDSVDDLIAALEDEEISLGKLHSDGMTLPIRLSPPSKGYSDPKRQYAQGGSVGKRDDMDELLERMI